LPDTVINHYPISAENFQRWNKELLLGNSTIKQPSQHLIISLVGYRKRSQKSQKEQVVEKEDSTISHIEKLASVMLIKELKSIGQNPYLPQQYSPPYLNVEAPQNLSPVQLETNPVKLLSQFFKWLAY